MFISSGGSTQIKKFSFAAVEIVKKAFFSKKIKFIFLRDKNDLDQQEITKKENNGWKILKRREIENYLFDIEILRKYDKKLDQKQFEKIVTCINNDDVKKKWKEIKALCKKDNINNENDFKLKLAKLITPETKVYKELEKIIFFK